MSAYLCQGTANHSRPLVPPYGTRTLAEVGPALLAALGAPGPAPDLGVPPARSACLLLVDGLGAELLAAHGADAPVLAGLAAGREPLHAGFPATTATSVTTLGTGLPPGRHGIAGYTFAAGPGLLNALTWCSHAVGRPVDLRDAAVPEEVQPHPTIAERTAAAGLTPTLHVPRLFAGSGLTRAAMRGGAFRGTRALGDLAAGVLAALAEPRTYAYAYHGDLDLVGHVHGPGSAPWRLQLALVDRLVELLVERLPPGALLAVVADHGMVTVTDPVDADAVDGLRDGVRLLGGDPRARYVHAEPGAAGDVLATWRAVLGERADVRPTDEAVDAGWFGPVDAAVRPRLGDVVVACRGGTAVVRRTVEPDASALVGHHGSLTAAEQLVPFLLAGPA